MTRRKRPPEQAQELVNFLKARMASSDISLRTLAAGSGISASYLSEILHQKKVPEILVCNAIANYLGVPKIRVLQMSGWLDEEDLHIAMDKNVEN